MSTTTVTIDGRRVKLPSVHKRFVALTIASPVRLQLVLSSARATDARESAQRFGCDSVIVFDTKLKTVMQDDLVTVRLPQKFYDDHRGRGLPCGSVDEEQARHYIVTLSRLDYDELLDDARFYCEPSMIRDLGPDYFGLCSSARSTVQALVKCELPWDGVAHDRAEHEPCQRGTVGCSVDHKSESECATW